MLSVSERSCTNVTKIRRLLIRQIVIASIS
jgi:hypothetical protein